jgi:Uma2 family endonuclease
MATADPPLRISLADNGRRMTLEEFEQADEEEGYRYELARGVLEVTYVPDDPHGFIVDIFNCAIVDYRRLHPDRIIRSGGAGEFRLWLPALISGRNPDYAVVLRGTPKDHRGRRAPSLVVEVVSEGAEARNRDYETKKQEYLAFGLQEYWIIDREMRRVTVLTRNGDAWIETSFGDGQSASGLVLPGFAVPVVDLWVIPDDEEPSA